MGTSLDQAYQNYLASVKDRNSTTLNGLINPGNPYTFQEFTNRYGAQYAAGGSSNPGSSSDISTYFPTGDVPTPEAAATPTSTGGSSGTGGMSGYDAGTVTPRERNAAGNLGTLAGFNADSTKNQLRDQLGNFDTADQQNRALSDVQLNQNRRKASSDRFGANKKLQTATQGVLGAAGNAVQGSSLFELLNMLRTRTDLDNNEVWNILTQNNNAVENAYTEAFNSNRLARNDANINAEFGLRGIEADTASQLNNINPGLFTAPGTGDASVGAAGLYDNSKLGPNMASLSGYIMPDDAQTKANKEQKPNTMTGNSYYDNLLNQYNQRSR